MLGDPSPPPLTEFDRQAFQAFVPANHFLRRALQDIPWDRFHEMLAPYYSPDQGRPSEPPVLMLKLEYLRYHFGLSDREVIERAQTDLACRCFLQVDVYHRLPDPSSLCLFRGRLGREGFQKVFQQVVGWARELGLVKDRLRLKDASHVIAHVAVPATLALLAQARDKLLAAAEPFDVVRVEGERVNLELIRDRTDRQNNEQRLLARVTHLREILLWVDELTPPEDASTHRVWQTLVQQRRMAHKILADQENPQDGDRTISTVDPDARWGRHGEWYKGYLVDLSMDADSELITQLNVLPAGGDEAGDAVHLISQEEEAHGNEIEAISIDGAGFNGRMLRELEDPEGLNVNTFVPPPPEHPTKTFTPEDFVEETEAGYVTCPADQKSSYRHRNSQDAGWIYQFKQSTCNSCPLLAQCMNHPPKGWSGKSVRKNDYEKEYRKARAKATTPEYAKVRAEHPKIERKLGEVLNRHAGRDVWYHGLDKVLTHELMAGFATNVKRILHLRCAPTVELTPAT